MKKFMFMAMAACLILAACGNGGTKNGSNDPEDVKEVVEMPANFVKYEAENFSLMYPNDLEISWESDDLINLQSPDGDVFIDATFSEWGTSANQLKDAGKNWVSMKETMGATTVEQPVVKGNVMTARFIEDGDLDGLFIVSAEKGSHCVAGNLKMSPDKEDLFNKYFPAIVASIEVK
jgi:hypothetical protein